MDERIITFVPKNPAEAEKRLRDQEEQKFEQVFVQAGYGGLDKDFDFKKPEDYTSKQLLTKWEQLLDELKIQDVFEGEEKQNYEEPYRLIMEVDESMARDCLANNYKFVTQFGTAEERQEYIHTNKNLLLYIRRLRSFINNNPK